MTDLEARLALLERRVRELEDHKAIYQLVSAYGPLVDSGAAAATAELWWEDGFYDWAADLPIRTGHLRPKGTPAPPIAVMPSRRWCGGRITRRSSPAARVT